MDASLEKMSETEYVLEYHLEGKRNHHCVDAYILALRGRIYLAEFAEEGVHRGMILSIKMVLLTLFQCTFTHSCHTSDKTLPSLV